ncbi:MAG: site-specific integrase [Rhodospirillaceae bacterium]|nr:site-specific integrase [Rhodospirillaceae bacterium]
MARQINRLSARGLEAKPPGMHPDGGGLYLQVAGDKARSWIFRFSIGGRERLMGLGPFGPVTLAQARQKADDARQKVGAGIDPIKERRDGKQAAKLDAAKSITFKECGRQYIEAHNAGWKNEKHKAQWASTLEAYVYPVFGDLSVQSVDLALVTKVLEPIWTKKTETATRVRQRIEAVLDWAGARGYRSAENPARWRGLLNKLLPKPSKVRAVVHHAAMPYSEIGDFMIGLRKHDSVTEAALEFAILTAARSGEVTEALWPEVDLNGELWTIGANRMKAKKEHRVPLSPAAVAVLKRMKVIKRDEFVFPGLRKGRPISGASLSDLMDRLGAGKYTLHGFRSCFRDWVAEQTAYPNEVAEMALAHAVGDKVEAAYRRGDLFEKRRRLMDDWAKYCARPSKKPGVVVPIRGEA